MTYTPPKTFQDLPDDWHQGDEVPVTSQVTAEDLNLIGSSVADYADGELAATTAELTAALATKQDAATATTDDEFAEALAAIAANAAGLATKSNASTVTAALANKADLVDGKVPASQLPAAASGFSIAATVVDGTTTDLVFASGAGLTPVVTDGVTTDLTFAA